MRHFDCSGVRKTESVGVGVGVGDGEAPGEDDPLGSAVILESLLDLANLTTRIMTTTRMVMPMSAAAI